MGQPYEKSSMKLSKTELVLNNFVGGLFWALGATVGLAVIFTLLTLVSKNINVVPVFGSFVSDIINFVIKNNPNFHK